MTEVEKDASKPEDSVENGTQDESDEEPPPGLYDRSAIQEGKRERKKVERLSTAIDKETEGKVSKFKIPEGKGTKLGDIPLIEHNLSRKPWEIMKTLHMLLYKTLGKQTTGRKDLRQFCGFEDDDPHEAYRTKKLNAMTGTELKQFCLILDLERGGNKDDLVQRILDFIKRPKDNGGKVPESKKKKSSKKGSKKSKSKRKSSSSSSKPKKSKASASSGADNTASDSEDEADKSADSSQGSSSESEDDAEKENQGSGSESEEEKPKNTPAKKPKTKTPAKKQVAKKPTKETKKQSVSRKRKASDESSSKSKKSKIQKKEQLVDDADISSDSDEEEANKSSSKQKPSEDKKVPKKEEIANDGDSSSDSDEEPLAAMKAPKMPSEEELEKIVQGLLKGVNLEEVTMKTVLKDVAAKYPDVDLSSKKDFLKSTVRKIVSGWVI